MSDYIYNIEARGEYGTNVTEESSKLRAIKSVMDMLDGDPHLEVIVTARYTAATRFFDARAKFFESLKDSGISLQSIHDFLPQTWWDDYNHTVGL